MAKLEYDKYGNSQPVDFELHGHPGRFYKSSAISSSTQYDYTGSNRGVGAVLFTNTSNVTIHLSGGGSIAGSALNTNEVYELSVAKVEVGVSGAGYALYRNLRTI